MTYILVILFTILAVLAVFYAIGWKVDKKKKMLYDQYIKQIKEIDMKKRKRSE